MAPALPDLLVSQSVSQPQGNRPRNVGGQTPPSAPVAQRRFLTAGNCRATNLRVSHAVDQPFVMGVATKSVEPANRRLPRLQSCGAYRRCSAARDKLADVSRPAHHGNMPRSTSLSGSRCAEKRGLRLPSDVEIASFSAMALFCSLSLLRQIVSPLADGQP